ncbi:MAG: 7TM diverse intracellular signaling [Spirochaetes bacterium ADurb.BinA120]|nr:MAG: 7TM diverse intracellular signaling [Spirochaetes bacterium ADurb.BinA120]
MKSVSTCVALTGTILLSIWTNAAAKRVDLTAEAMYVREGFSKEWVQSIPEKGAPGWIEIAPGKGGKRAIAVKELKFDGVTTRQFMSLKHYPDKTYTFITRFEMDKSDIDEGRIPGLSLKSIGMNWEIFINGRMVREEMHLEPDGSIRISRGMRDVFFPIDPKTLREGENILGFRIIGNPSFSDTGLYQSTPYFIDDYEKTVQFNSELLSISFIFLYLFFGIYHVFLYLNRRSERYNLFFGLFTILLSVYLFMRTHTVYSFIFDTNIVYKLELISLFTLIPLLGSFFETIIEQSLSMVTKVYGALCALLIILVPFSPLPFSHDVLRIWQATVLAPLLYYFIITIGKSFILEVRKTRNKSQDGPRPYSESIRKALIGTVPGNILLGVIVLFATTLFDIIDAVFLSLDLVLTRYGFFFFVVGNALILANRFIFLHGKVEKLNTDLERKLYELDAANRTIGLSEEKYRLLVEGTKEGIFSLAEDWSFLTANRAFMKLLGIQAADLGSIKFQDLIFEDPEEKSVMIRLVERRLDEFMENRVPLEIKLKLKSAFAAEPMEFNVKLEFITMEGRNEVLGRAATAAEDSLLQYFISERQSFEIGNYLRTADDLSYRLVRNVARYMDTPKVNLLRIGLREMIINAIEHGNLEISFEEKSIEVMSDNYMEFVAARQHVPKYQGRKVGIELSLTPERVAYKITDMGEGFDHSTMLDRIRNKVNSEMLAHGRGITMAMNVFDEITYNRRGNQVLLVKRFA